MDVTVLLLLPLVAGYFFCRQCNLTRYLVSREEGHRLYFRAALYGFVLFLLVLMLRQWLEAHFPTFKLLEGKFRALLLPYLKDADKSYTFDISVAAVGSVIVALPIAKLVNVLYWRGRALANAIKHDDFEQLLNDAVARTIPVAVTMLSRKVYVGFVTQTFDPGHDRKWIKLLPLVSGYRDKDNLRIEFVTNYRDAYGSVDPTNPGAALPAPLGHLAPKDFGVVLPLGRIESANLFDLVAYKSFKTGPTTLATGPTPPLAALRRMR
jgi:hypothetical protein